MAKQNEERRIVTIRPPKGKAIKHETWRFYSIVNTLRTHHAARREAYETALWLRQAKAGEKREIYPGIALEVTAE